MPLEEKKKRIDPASQPLVSIITPLYNANRYIKKTIQSVLDQTYSNWELLLVNDASTDASLSTAEIFAKQDSRIIILKVETNQGAAHCRNLATRKSKGTYIAFLDADDLWHPQKLEKQIRFMMKHNCDVSYTSYLHIDQDGETLHKRIKAMPSLHYSKQHKNNYIGNLTGVYNSAILGKIIAPNIRKRQDWAVWLEAIEKSGKPALGIQEDLAHYRIHNASMSNNKWKLVTSNFQFYRTHLGYSESKALGCLLVFFWEYFINRPKWIEQVD